MHLNGISYAFSSNGTINFCSAGTFSHLSCISYAFSSTGTFLHLNAISYAFSSTGTFNFSSAGISNFSSSGTINLSSAGKFCTKMPLVMLLVLLGPLILVLLGNFVLKCH